MPRSTPLLNGLFCVLLLLFILPTAVFADSVSKPPTQDKQGDYHHCRNQKYWIVVDQDWKNGFNGRLSSDFPSNWDDCDSRWPEKPDISSWPVVIKFFPDMLLNGCQGNCGTITIEDNKGNPWLMVRIGIDKICFVRANSRYIKPVSVSDK